MQSPNGSEIKGTLETLSGCALAYEFDETGEPNYQGETEIWWDEQKTVTNDKGQMLYLDEDGNEWTWDQLTPLDDDNVEEGEEDHSEEMG
jgi:hypothetical protein